MIDKNTIAAYGRKHDDYAKMPLAKDHAHALHLFCDAVPKGSRVLDLGCGPGTQAVEMRDRGLEVTALDATPEFVQAAQSLGVDARLGTFDDVTERDTYNGVWASFSLLHAPKSDFPRHLQAIQTALTPAGLLFLGMKLGTGEHRDDLGRFYAYYEETELHDLLNKARFSDLQSSRHVGKGLAGTLDPYVLIFARA